MEHRSHPDIVKRLKRAEGHLCSILKMFEKKRGCLDLAQQLHAIEKAVESAKREMIHDHIDHCLHGTTNGDQDARATLKEMKALAKYL